MPARKAVHSSRSPGIVASSGVGESCGLVGCMVDCFELVAAMARTRLLIRSAHDHFVAGRKYLAGSMNDALYLVCPLDGTRLRDCDGALKCDCGNVYPVIGGVAILVHGIRVVPRTNRLPPGVIDELLDAFAIPPSRRAAVEQVFSHEFLFAEDWIQTEADQFLNRVAASHEGLRQALESAQARSAASNGECDAPLAQKSSLLNFIRRVFGFAERDVLPPPCSAEHRIGLSCIFNITKLRPKMCTSVNIRVENSGKTTLCATGPHPFRLSYDWIDAQGLRVEGRRTELLDDILPGRSLTLPLFFDTPKVIGRYRLSIRVVQEGVRWFDHSSVEFDIEIGKGLATVDDPDWKKTCQSFDYTGDHFEGLRLVAEWRDTLFARPVEHVVELGGNASPMIDFIAAPHKHNIDIDPYGMIMGNLTREGGDSTVRFVVADGMALPMRARSIDMLVLFATLHHFPDPIGLLSRLGDFVADDGLICLLCEPIGHVHLETLSSEYLKEIRRGVNEQSFQLWEYQQMFTGANLNTIAAQIDVGSAKFALRPRR